MSREGLADLIASLTQPNVAARYRDVRGVAVEPSPVSTAHRDRWRARVKRTKDTGRLRFTERGVHLANNLAVPWNARGAANPTLWLVLDVVARYPDPQTALEMLGEHRLWPWAPGDVHAPRWWCGWCGHEDRDVRSWLDELRKAPDAFRAQPVATWLDALRATLVCCGDVPCVERRETWT